MGTDVNWGGCIAVISYGERERGGGWVVGKRERCRRGERNVNWDGGVVSIGKGGTGGRREEVLKRRKKGTEKRRN